MSYLPQVEDVRVKTCELERKERLHYLSDNCANIETRLKSPPTQNPVQIRLTGVDKGDWKSYYVFFPECDEAIVAELKKRGFNATLGKEQDKHRSSIISIDNILSGDVSTGTTTSSWPTYFSVGFTLLNTRAYIVREKESATTRLRSMLQEAFKNHDSCDRSVSVRLNDAWLSYAAVDEKKQIERDRPGFTVYVNTSEISIHW